MQVPVDYAEPEGETIGTALVRHLLDGVVPADGASCEQAPPTAKPLPGAS